MSDEAQEFEIAAYEFDVERKKQYLDTIESKLSRDSDGNIKDGQSLLKIYLARMELL